MRVVLVVAVSVVGFMYRCVAADVPTLGPAPPILVTVTLQMPYGPNKSNDHGQHGQAGHQQK